MSKKSWIIFGLAAAIIITALVWLKTEGKLAFDKNSSDASAIDWQDNAPSQATYSPGSLDTKIESHQHE